MSHGYGKCKGLKIISWNKGSKFFVNKINDIKEMLDKFKPHVLSMSEAHIKSIDLKDINIDNYNLEYDNLMENNIMSRSCMLIHKDVKYERLYEHEPKFCSVIIVEIGLKYQKKFIAIQWYRQWQLLNKLEPESLNISLQKERCEMVYVK